jgi:hypothetical protein
MRIPAMNLRATLALAALALLPMMAQAQASEQAPSSDTIQRILEQEVAPQPGGYTYNPQGRRDPFVSLLKPVGPQGAAGQRPPGMEGFLIQEVALKGIVRTSGPGAGSAERPGYIAMFQGTDGKSYFVNVGQRMYDGQITAIDAATVTFRQEVTDPLSPVRVREIKKSLYPTEEARQ